MFSLSWVMILMVMKMMMMRDTASADIIMSVTAVTSNSGENVRLSPDLHEGRMGTRRDFRWTHLHLLLNKRTTRCDHGRCELQEDGSLSFSPVQPEDSGTYTLEVFDQHGQIKEKKVFVLQVEDITGSRTPIIPMVIPLLLLLLFIIMFFILRKRRLHRSRTSGPKEETQVYMSMNGNQGNKDKQEEKAEEPLYVPCHPGVPAESAENVYV